MIEAPGPVHAEPAPLADSSHLVIPPWLENLRRSLAVRSQFVVSGNIRDVVLIERDGRPAPLNLLQALWEAFAEYRFDYFLVHDRVDGIAVYPNNDATRQRVAADLQATFVDGYWAPSLAELPRIARRLQRANGARSAMVMDYASRLITEQQPLSGDERELFTAAEKLSHTAHPIMVNARTAFNPVIWLVDRPNDLPDFLTVGNEGVRSVSVPHPDLEARQKAARMLAPSFVAFDEVPPDMSQQLERDFANLTEGFTLRSMIAVSQMARANAIPWSEVTDAVRAFKVGIANNPWRSVHLRGRVANAEAMIGERLKGQHQAVTKTLDSLKRSIMGLSGAQASRESGRPRGILFFAGPTGVGKTELAKAITQVVFGNEQAYIRFDMSEFSQEHSDARLIGAPPGYVGFDAGGELTNAVRQRPFSVVLFDEIEKAHPRILDKFLQVLEDGRLTDGRGNTVYFSETVIVFTSNLGVFVEGKDGHRVQQVMPGAPYAEVERRIREAIEHYFKFQLSRPEILNRFGDNIIVFNFIEPPVAEQIFEKMLDSVRQRVRDEHRLELVIPADVRQHLLEVCTGDLSHGGRGIGNRMETAFVNPLARAMFTHPIAEWRLRTDGQRAACRRQRVHAGTAVNVRINKAHYPVATLGPGTRVGIWFQGCTLACPGCLSRDTWEADEGTSLPLASLIAWIDGLEGPIDGVTISGGEPFQQPVALAGLLDGLDAWRRRSRARGRPARVQWFPVRNPAPAPRRRAGQLDAVITEPFRRERALDRMPGSVRPTSASFRYRRSEGAATWRRPRRRAVCRCTWMARGSGTSVSLESGDIERIDEALRERGIDQRRVSWRP
jgi:ATP-dependent Clp protease ATP-binding subunit ClpB